MTLAPTEGTGPGCSRAARDARVCHLILGAFPMAPNQKCECLCHTWCDDDEPRGRWPWVTDADVEE